MKKTNVNFLTVRDDEVLAWEFTKKGGCLVTFNAKSIFSKSLRM